MRLRTESHRFNGNNPWLIQQCDTILTDLNSRGYSLTLRSLYYQLVSRNIIPNSQAEYNKLSKLMTNARRAGLIDWSHIMDGTRELSESQHYETPQEILEQVANAFNLNLWQTQPLRVEVWVEKSALLGTLERLCRQFDVGLLACRGNPSATILHETALRIRDYFHRYNQPTLILYCGDHDPTGLNIPETIVRTLQINGLDEIFNLERLCLNIDQVKEYRLPPNPAKETDSNYKKYKDLYGDQSWELDALPPDVLVGIVKERLVELLDVESFNERVNLQDYYRQQLSEIRL